MDVADGTRGRRGAGVEALLTSLTGAEAGFAVERTDVEALLPWLDWAYQSLKS